MMNLFAQATNVPSNGASNAEDFQPLTRNPQPTQGGLQPGTGTQSTSGQDILSQENSRIVVPVSGRNNEATSAQPQAHADGGINWILVAIVAAGIVIPLEYFFRRRDKRTERRPETADMNPQEVVTVPAIEPEPVAEAAPEKPAPQKKKGSTAKKKTKSKSKRKKSRK